MTTQYVAFSGGNDSTALALSMPDAIPIFTDTGWEFDETYEHIERFESITGREVIRIKRDGETLPEYIESSKFFPNHGARYCTRMFKIEPMNKFLSGQQAELCIGLRADEPESERVGNLTEIDGLTIRYPLREMGMTIYDVLKINIEAGLLVRKTPGMARGGCEGCFYKRLAEVRAMYHLHRNVFDRLQKLEESVQDERGQYFHMFPNAGKSLADIRAEMDAQPLLFSVEETYRAAADTSDVGVACGLFCNR
jgi:hypothetical protein